MENNKTICIVGIGNPLRGDDGVAADVCKQIEKEGFAGVTVILRHQLDIAMAEDLSKFEKVVIIDASVDEPGCSLQSLTLEDHQPQSFSHHINAAMLMSLTNQLYEAKTAFYICAIGVADFEMGQPLSETTRHNATLAISLITKWLQAGA